MEGSMRVKFVIAIAAACLTACATTNSNLSVDNSAELSFAKQPSPGGLPGRFTQIDTQELRSVGASVRVPAGRHTVTYTCPDTVTLDAYPVVTAKFVAGKRYALSCEANKPGSITER